MPRKKFNKSRFVTHVTNETYEEYPKSENFEVLYPLEKFEKLHINLLENDSNHVCEKENC